MSSSLCKDICSVWTDDYIRLARQTVEKAASDRSRNIMLGSLQRHLVATVCAEKADGFSRMEKCRMALRILDNSGWKRSHHQKLFHESYIRACSKIFFKVDGEAAFLRAHQQLLKDNNWPHIQSEVLISTPRRFGKTISVSMFAAAMIFSCDACEISIYSTC
jgi:hypothetical protein